MTYCSSLFARHAIVCAIAGLFCAHGACADEVAATPAATSASSTTTVKPLAVTPVVKQESESAKTVRVDGAAVIALETARSTSWPGEQSQFAQAVTDLGLSLLRDQAADQNSVASPFSLANALGLVQIASKGKTGRELSALFAPTSSGTALLGLRMAEINSTFLKPFEGATVTSANRLWVSQSLAKTLDPAYAQKAQKQFQSDAQLVAFELPESAAASINDWVKLKTHGNIPQLLQAAQLKGNTHLVVTNAVHFKGRWATPFDPARTVPAAFTLVNGSKVEVPTMRNTLRAGFASMGGAQLLELPYKSDDLSMQIVLPAAGQTLTALQASLSGAQWSAWAASMKPTLVDVSLPRFKMGGKVIPLKPSLQKLGVETVFTQAADLSALSPANGLMLDDVYQSATVLVDEEGAEAAAATAAVGTAKSLSFPARVDLNRPFLFAIIHKPTQTQLFVGRVMNPAL